MSELISPEFFKDLEDGILCSLTAKIRADDTLLLAFRKNCINIYYRGGSILRLANGNKPGRYTVHFDKNYAKASPESLPDLPSVISNSGDCAIWLQAVPALKEIMNGFFATHTKSEREFQQLVAWENNRSGISNETEYFITDIEFAGAVQSARLDMLGLRWLSADRKHDSRCTPVFVEMKYGIGAYDGTAGIAKHVEDLNAILSNADTREQLNKAIEAQFNQLSSLDLLKFNKSKAFDHVRVSGSPEVFFPRQP